MNANHAPLRIPESMSATDIGSHLASLRTQYNLSQLDVSERLHIRMRYIAALEAGQMDQLPGTAYAKGYLQTYAEFLGLDGDQVVAQCFPARVATATPLKSSVGAASTYAQPAHAYVTPGVIQQWRGLAVAAVVALVALLVITQIMSNEDTATDEEASVAPVPEALLAGVRTGLMPVPQNYDCFIGHYWLACVYADNTTRLIASPDTHAFPEINANDIAAMTQDLPQPTNDSASTPAEEDTP